MHVYSNNPFTYRYIFLYYLVGYRVVCKSSCSLSIGTLALRCPFRGASILTQNIHIYIDVTVDIGLIRFRAICGVEMRFLQQAPSSETENGDNWMNTKSTSPAEYDELDGVQQKLSHAIAYSFILWTR